MSILSGKYALVSGGGTGIGLGIAARLLQSGAKVTIAGRRAELAISGINMAPSLDEI